MRRHRERRSIRLRHQGDAGELRRRQGRPPRHVRRHRPAALVRQDRQRGAHRERAGRAGSDVAARHRARHRRRAAASQPRASALAHRSQQQCWHRRARDRIRVSSRRRLDRAHHRAQGRPVRLRQARARLPAGDRRRRARRLEGYQHGAGQAGILPARGRIAQSGSQDRRARRRAQGARQQHRHGGHGLHGLLDGDRLPHRGRLLPYRRHAHVGAHVLPVVAPRLRAHSCRWPGPVPHRPHVVHRLHAARNGGMGTARGRGGGVTAMAELNTIQLTLPAATDDLRKLQIGTVAYLSGRIFTAREGAYKRAIEDGAGMPAARDALGLANFHCSPAATVNADGSYTVGAVTATASFRFAQWLDGWFQLSGCNVIIGKGGMTSEVYRKSFVPNHAIYLTTVGYGTGALLGRGIKRVAGVYWLEELGLAQAVWVLDVDKFGPFLVESDLAGNSLFERENAKIAPGLAKLYAGTKPATLRRYGETDDKTEEVI